MVLTVTNSRDIRKHQGKWFFLLFLLVSISLGVMGHDAYAEICTTATDGTPTPEFIINNATMISDMILKIKSKLMIASDTLYVLLLIDVGLITAVHAAMVMYIMIYGIMFISGIIPIKLYDFVVRLMKIAILGIIFLNLQSYFTFLDIPKKFFIDGVDHLIAYVAGYSPLTTPFVGSFINDLSAFTPLDNALGKVFSSKMFVTLLALTSYPAYGMFYAFLLMAAIWSFIKALVTAVWIYLMSLVVRILLLGLAPIFIPTIMFQRSKPIFDGWINQLISASLQPVLLFTFFIFFVRMMEGSIDLIIYNPLCFSPLPEGYRGSPFDFSFWQFMQTGASGWIAPNAAADGPPPVSLIAILIFLVISEIAGRFNNIIIQIASQIASAGTNLAAGLESAMDSAKNSIVGSAGRKK